VHQVGHLQELYRDAARSTEHKDAARSTEHKDAARSTEHKDAARSAEHKNLSLFSSIYLVPFLMDESIPLQCGCTVST
jgi:hypothetical protein